MPFRLKLAIAMGATPLLVGTLIYVTWRVTRWDWLELAGLFTIFWGLLAFAIGSIALLNHLRLEMQLRPLLASRPKTNRSRMPFWLEGVLVGGLLLVNFPAAAFYIQSASEVISRYIVSIDNTSDDTIDSLVLLSPGMEVQVGPIPAGEQVRQQLHFRGEGALIFTAQQHGEEFGGEVDGYVTGNFERNVVITVKNNGQFEVEHISN